LRIVGKAGGIVGFVASSATLIKNTKSDIDVEGQWGEFGGLVGYLNGGTIEDSLANGKVQSTFGKGDIGGLVGLIANGGTTIQRSYATGDVIAYDGTSAYYNNVGGLVGQITNSGPTITQSFAEGSLVQGNSNVGGLIGLIGGGTVTDVYASVGTVEAYGDFEGGLVGIANVGTVSRGAAFSNLFSSPYPTNYGEVFGGGSATVCGGGTPTAVNECYYLTGGAGKATPINNDATTNTMQIANTAMGSAYGNLDLSWPSGVWMIEEGVSHPRLSFNNRWSYAPGNKGSNINLEIYDLGSSNTATFAGRAVATVSGAGGIKGGKWYWEVTIDTLGSGSIALGVTTSYTADLSNVPGVNSTGQESWVLKSNGYRLSGNSGTTVINEDWTPVGALAATEVVGIAFDVDAGSMRIFVDGVDKGLVFGNTEITGDAFYPIVGYEGTTSSGSTSNFGQRPWATTTTIPAGYRPLNENY